MSVNASFKIGFIVNPIAGMGSKVGLHGTDGANSIKALAKGAKAQSAERAEHALSKLSEKAKRSINFFANSGALGGEILENLGIKYTDLQLEIVGDSTATHTKMLAAKLLELNVDLILFAGGDGTARDIHSVVGEKNALLGIPCGVKMRSGIFANFVNDISLMLNEISENFDARYTFKEILDVEEASNNIINYGQTAFFGVAKTIVSQNRITNSKARSMSEIDLDFEELALNLITEIKNEPHTLFLIGPGSSTLSIKSKFGTRAEMYGVDAIYDGELIGTDLSESEILNLQSQIPSSKLIIGVIGGQGFLFGRGNQQLSGAVVSRIGWENIKVIATEAKILGLFPAELLVEFAGFKVSDFVPRYIKVLTSPTRSILCRIRHCYLNTSEVDSDSQVSYGKAVAANG